MFLYVRDYGYLCICQDYDIYIRLTRVCDVAVLIETTLKVAPKNSHSDLMYLNLRHIILLMSAGWLLSSCASDASDGWDIAQRSEMQFAVSSVSRASVATNINTLGSKFAIYGDMKFKDNDLITIFDNTIVKYGVNNQWGYSDTQYWFPKHEHSFVAIYPADATGISDTKYYNSQLSFTYIFPDNYKFAQDLMVATHRRIYEENLSSLAAPVTLRFWHIMSRVNFQVKNDGAADIVRVTKIEMEGVDRAGTFAIAPATLSSGSVQTDDYTYSWTDISNSGTITADISVDVPEDEERPLFPDDNAMFAVPQPDNKNILVKITYTLYDANAELEELILTAITPIGGWEPGKIYTYSATISEITKEIYLTVSVKDWHPDKTLDIPVPEY